MFRDKKHVRNLADAARDAKDYRRAAVLYQRYLRRTPDDAAINIQCGHMLKEIGDHQAAEQYYLRACQLTPNDADLALQLGHFYKVAGRLAESELAYRKAIDLDPDWPTPAIELARLYDTGWRNHTRRIVTRQGPLAESTVRRIPAFGTDDGNNLWLDAGLVPEISPQQHDSKYRDYADEISIQWLGRRERTPWGNRSTVRGVDAIRGYCISSTPIIELQAFLNGLRFYSGTLQSSPLKFAKPRLNKRKYVFNLWYDFSHFRDGLYELRLHFLDDDGGLRSHVEHIGISTPLNPAKYPDSDRVVAVSPNDDRTVEEQINSQPSMVRPARRTFPTPKNILLVRVDQLGDLIVSIPAIRRLRELLPAARFTGLLSPANNELAKTIDHLFDETIVANFREDEWEERRVMPLEEQHALRRQLESHAFDMAIDLAESQMSRPMLLLSGAPLLAGFKDDAAPWLTMYTEGWVRDPVNTHQAVPVSVKTIGLVEWIGANLGTGHYAKTIRRKDLTRDQLIPYGLDAFDEFVVLHTGARLKFSQWPHYIELARMILGYQRDVKVVMMTDDATMRSRLPTRLANEFSDRFVFLDRRLPFDDFDAFLSFCTCFVGNDSGPGHLASLRGANVVTLFLARQNWNEWGHENNGYIITRRVPCAGCNIFYNHEECGKNFACLTNIKPEEVFRTVMQYLPQKSMAAE